MPASAPGGSAHCVSQAQIRHRVDTDTAQGWAYRAVWFVDLLFPPQCAACGVPGSVRRVARAGPLGPRVFWPTWLRREPAGAPDACRSASAAARHRLAGRALRECSGRRLAFASARAAVRTPPRPGRSCAPGRSAACARSPRRRCGARRRGRASAGGRRHHLYPARRRPATRSGATTRPRARPGARGPLGPRGDAAARANAAGRRQARLDPARAPPATCAARSPPGRSPAPATARGVVLVDDVYTTGATVSGCGIGAPRRRAPGRVHVVTFARASAEPGLDRAPCSVDPDRGRASGSEAAYATRGLRSSKLERTT